jgi:serine/threonine protein phosphatase PrpC
MMIPDAEKKNEGEDAMFILPSAVGVFDGVGGWKSSGVDPGIYSRRLALEVANYISNASKKDMNKVDVRKALNFAASECQKARIAGSTTACFGVLDERSGVLTVLNLGDSGIIVLRRDGGEFKVAHATEPTTLGFNFPCQIGNAPIPMVWRPSNAPEDATVDLFQLRSGDVMVYGSDGVWDNVFEKDIIQILKNSSMDVSRPASISENELKVLATKIAKLAVERGNSETEKTPWTVSAQQAFKDKPIVLYHNRYFIGGKPDDVTVVVSLLRDGPR